MINKTIFVRCLLVIILTPLLSIPGAGEAHNGVFATVAHAQTVNRAGSGGTNANPANDLWPVVNRTINTIRGYLIPIAVLIIIYAGITYETSAFNPSMQGTAKTILWTTISGLVFLMLYPTLVGILSDAGLIPTTNISAGGTAT